MEKKKKNAGQAPLYISARGLQGRQSVRVTFRLPEPVIRLLAAAAAQLGLKQKSLFDQLLDDAGVLRQVADQALEYEPEQGERRPKTFVLSRQSLEVLARVAEERQVHRDILVEISIRRLLPVMAAEREKHLEREQLYRELKRCLTLCRKLLRRADERLGSDDPASSLLRKVAVSCEESTEALAGLVERGEALEEYAAAEVK